MVTWASVCLRVPWECEVRRVRLVRKVTLGKPEKLGMKES